MDEQSAQQRIDTGVASSGAESPYPRLFDVSPCPAVVTRLQDHTVLAINQHASDIFGVPQDEAYGQSVLP